MGRSFPQDYNPLTTPKETHKAIFHLRREIGDNLCKELGPVMVQVPLIVNVESGSMACPTLTPIQFHICDGRGQHPIDAQVVRAPPQSGNALLYSKDAFLVQDDSAYADQWDWERVITSEQRNLAFLKLIVG